MLDNCEHLLAAVASLSDTLLRALPQVRLLATSREALTISGETIYRVPSLSLPDPKETQTPESLSQFEAVQLFIDRALAVAPAFTITNANAPALAAICHRLDGIPLALELAAARCRAMTLEQISARLDNRFHLLTGGSRAALPRQQTLRALIDWSFSLLTESEQMLFCRLSVFIGGWTLEAAEAICADADESAAEPAQNPQPGIQNWEVLDLLTLLADKSLVVYAEQHGAARYRLLESVRQYAGDRQAERDGGAALRDCHRDYYLTMARRTFPQGKDAPTNLAVLEAEHDNLRAALSASFDSPDSVEQMLASLHSIGTFRRIRGYYSEGRDSLQAALAAAGKGRTAARASALVAALFINMALGNFDEARRQSEESVEIQRALAEPLKLANALMNHGNLLIEMSDFPAGRQALEEGLALHLAQGGSGMGFYGNLGNALIYLGEHEAAETMLTREIALNQQAGIKEWEAAAVYNLGRVALARADYEVARAYFTDSLEICRDLDFRMGLLFAILGLSMLAATQRQNERAARLLGAHDALNERLGSCLPPVDQPDYDRHSAALRVALGEEAFTAAYEVGRALDWQEAVALANSR